MSRIFVEELKAALGRFACKSCGYGPGLVEPSECRACGGHRFLWTGKGDKAISVSSMTDQHLGNSLRMLQRRIDSEERRPYDTSWKKVLLDEAGRRADFRWEVEAGAACTFEVRTDDADKPCGRPAITLVADKIRLTAEGGHRRVFYDRCEQHREDGLKFKKVPCGGCFRTDVNLVCELRVLEVAPARSGCEDQVESAFKSEFFCYSCSDRGGLLEAFLAMLVLILTVGRVRLERWDS